MNAALPSTRRVPQAPLALALSLALACGWPVVLSTFGKDDVYAYVGPYAIVVIIAAISMRRLGALPGAVTPVVRAPSRVQSALIGLIVGLVMTVGTYLAYAVCARLFPALEPHVAGLYSDSRTEHIALAIGWTLVILAAEELLWRGALFGATERRFGRNAAISLSLLTYTAAQAGSKSGIVVLAALVCGAIWTAERVLTRSLVAPLISHTMWTITVIHVYPVTHH